MSEGSEPSGTPGEEGRQPIFLLPGAVMAVAGLMIAIHLAASFILDAEGRLQFTIWFGFIPFRLIDPAGAPGGLWPLLWTPFTHAFLHAGWDHLLLNVAWFAIFATPVARRYGTVDFLIIFLLSAAAGALAFLATTWGEFQFLVGASGGVAGLTGAAIRFMFQPLIVGVDPKTGEKRALGRRLATLRELITQPRPRFFILIWILLNAGAPLLPLLGGGDIQIAWQAHLGGFFAGLLLAGLLEERARRRFVEWQKRNYGE